MRFLNNNNNAETLRRESVDSPADDRCTDNLDAVFHKDHDPLGIIEDIGIASMKFDKQMYRLRIHRVSVM